MKLRCTSGKWKQLVQVFWRVPCRNQAEQEDAVGWAWLSRGQGAWHTRNGVNMKEIGRRSKALVQGVEDCNGRQETGHI
jgi:hypothetical protein